MTTIIPLGTGKMSTFGGPTDTGVATGDGLALVDIGDLGTWWFSSLFLSASPPGTTGLARRLNPQAYYLAMRWDYTRFPRATLRNTVVKLTNPTTGLHVLARPVDFGPGDGSVIGGQPTLDTGRLADLSPGAATALGLNTDDLVTCELLL